MFDGCIVALLRLKIACSFYVHIITIYLIQLINYTLIIRNSSVIHEIQDFRITSIEILNLIRNLLFVEKKKKKSNKFNRDLL